MIVTPDSPNWLVLPPAPPANFWLENAPPDLVRLHEKQLTPEPFTKDEFVYYHAERGRRDLFFLAKHVLGFDRLQETLHAPIAYAWQVPTGTRLSNGMVMGQMRLAQIPRGHLKTTLCTIAYTIFLLIGDPDRRVLIYSSNLRMACKPFGAIRSFLEGKGRKSEFIDYGALFQACYGDLLPTRAEREKWSDSMLTIKRPTPYSDASIEASGIGAGINGSHFTDENIDDVVAAEETKEQMEKMCGYIDALLPLGDSLETVETRFVCTPWAFYDPGVYAERNWPNALVARRSMFEKDGQPLTDPRDFKQENMIYRWREDMGRAVEAARLMKKRNPFFFACQFECNPRDERRIGFKKQWFKYCVRRGDVLVELDQDGRATEHEVRLAACHTFILVDPNTGRVPGQKVDSNKPVSVSVDYVGIIVVAVSPENIWYVIEAYRERYDPWQFVNKIFELVSYHNPRTVAIEQRSSQRWIRTVFQSEWRRGRPIFSISDWQGGNESKPERIRGLIQRHGEGFIYYRTQAPEIIQDGIDGLIGELLDFPHAEHDDASDALSAGLQTCQPPGKDRQTLLTKLGREAEFERDMSKIDRTSQRVWRALNKKDHEGMGFGDDFWA